MSSHTRTSQCCYQISHWTILPAKLQIRGPQGQAILPAKAFEVIKQLIIQPGETVSREHLWHALTPQFFPTALLRAALKDAMQCGVHVTDEASAMEWAGLKPRLIEGRADNLKVTRPEDLEWLRQRWANRR